MKNIIRGFLFVAVLVIANIVRAELPDADTLSVIEATDPISADSLPMNATFYSAANPGGPPLPGDIGGLPAWDLGDGTYLLDDIDYAPSGGRFHSMDDSGPPTPDDSGGGDGGDDAFTNAYHFDTNGLWLEITNVSNGTAYLNLHNATDYVYEVWSKMDLLASNWDIAAEIFPTDTDSMPFTVPTLEQTNLFIWARDWTGITSNGNETPEWWFWEYFGTTDFSDTNLDSTGNYTLLYDYTNSLDPNIIQFSLVVTNNYVSNMSVPMQLNIMGGLPSYEAFLVDSTSFSGATWSTYASSNLTVNLGLTEGWHDVWVGLRGRADAPSGAVWEWVRLNLDLTPPMVAITSPTNGCTVNVPMIQLQGNASETLNSLTFDVSNAAGIFTNQTGCTTGQFYDTNLLAFTTNYFQCYDVALTNGLNTISVHAFDLADNETTTNIGVTVDYSGDTTPPALTVLWPTNGTPVSGSAFTLEAQVDDSTATVTASIIDTNGVTNIVQGLVERSGLVWVDGLPLTSDANTVTLTATDAAGNSTVTNLTVIGNDAGLTMNPLTDGQLNQSYVNVTGTVGDASYSVTVNGTAATVTNDLTWEADSVPVSSVGTAIFYVEVRDSSGNLVTAHTYTQPQSASIQLMSYSYTEDSSARHFKANWTYLLGGDYKLYSDTGSYPPGDEGADEVSDDFIYGWNGQYGLSHVSLRLGEPYVDADIDIDTHLMIEPMDKAAQTAMKSYIVQAQVWSFQLGGGPSGGDTYIQLSPDKVRIHGLSATVITNSDGSVWDETLVTAQAGSPVDVTPTAAGNITFDAQLVKTKEDWQQDVQNEIDFGSNVAIENYLASNGFMANRANIQAVYVFYQKLFTNNPDEFYWAGLAKLAGAPVYAGLSDAEHVLDLTTNMATTNAADYISLTNGAAFIQTFQQTLIQMNIDIYSDLAWQFEAYKNGGLDALQEIYAVDTLQTNLDSAAMTAWQKIDQGIQNSDSSLIYDGNKALLQREQQQILARGYGILNAMPGVTWVMSEFSANPVPGGKPFAELEPSGNIANYPDRWDWITHPSTGMWWLWLGASQSTQLGWVQIPLTNRATNYCIWLPIY